MRRSLQPKPSDLARTFQNISAPGTSLADTNPEADLIAVKNNGRLVAVAREFYPIQPPQSFCDAFVRLGDLDNVNDAIPWNNLNINLLSLAYFGPIWEAIGANIHFSNLDLTNNRLNIRELEHALLDIEACAGSFLHEEGVTLRLNGAGNGKVLAPNQTFWSTFADPPVEQLTVFYNCGSGTAAVEVAAKVADFSNCGLGDTAQNSLAAFLLANHADLGWTLDVHNCSRPSRATLALYNDLQENHGWTIKVGEGRR